MTSEAAMLFDDQAVTSPAVSPVETRLRTNIQRLLGNVAEGNFCKGCHAQIYWLKHKNGVKTPYDADGTNHFITCPKRAEFKRA